MGGDGKRLRFTREWAETGCSAIVRAGDLLIVKGGENRLSGHVEGWTWTRGLLLLELHFSYRHVRPAARGNAKAHRGVSARKMFKKKRGEKTRESRGEKPDWS